MPRVIALVALAGLAACQHRDPYAPAKVLITQHCAGCHVVPGVSEASGLVGPPLSGIAARQVLAGKVANNATNLQRFLLHPQAVLPGGAMPELGLTPAEARTISDYLMTLDDR